MSKFTVLVAVYNAAATLPRCLDSLLAQTLSDIQVVCVDDASTDDSWSVLEQYARRDQRIVIRHLDHNQGQAHARNQGLLLADGDYTTFVDSDDWLSADALAQAVSVFEAHPATDSVLFDVVYCYDDASRNHSYDMKPFEVKTGYNAFIDSLTWTIHGVYAVRTELHRRFPYDETCRTYSDDNTTRLHYYASREVRCCKGRYYYYQHPQSTSHIVSRSRYDFLLANRSMKRQLKELHVSQDILNRYENEMWLNIVGIYQFYFLHRHELSKADNRYGLSLLHDCWQRIETQRLHPHLRRKFGYCPMRHWPLFRLQEELYFTLKRLIGR